MPDFSKRHYEALALWMQSQQGGPDAHEWRVMVRALADRLAADNPKFKRDRFIAACNPGANVKARKS